MALFPWTVNLKKITYPHPPLPPSNIDSKKFLKNVNYWKTLTAFLRLFQFCSCMLTKIKWDLEIIWDLEKMKYLSVFIIKS